MSFSRDDLIKKARQAKEKAYAPYSGFCVGAALLGADGSIYQGCNIENAAFTPTVCAERVALFKAVSEGKRSFKAIAVVGDSRPCPPCGVCRQALSEFCGGDFEIIFEDGTAHTLSELLPLSFKLNSY